MIYFVPSTETCVGPIKKCKTSSKFLQISILNALSCIRTEIFFRPYDGCSSQGNNQFYFILLKTSTKLPLIVVNGKKNILKIVIFWVKINWIIKYMIKYNIVLLNLWNTWLNESIILKQSKINNLCKKGKYKNKTKVKVKFISSNKLVLLFALVLKI